MRLCTIVDTFAGLLALASDLPSAQAVIDAWRHAYNHNRPHQALDMVTPANVFRPGHTGTIGVIASDATEPETVVPQQPPQPAGDPPPAAREQPARLTASSAPAVQFDTVISASGVHDLLRAYAAHLAETVDTAAERDAGRARPRQQRLAATALRGADIFGAGTAAGARLAMAGRFLEQLGNDIIRSAQKHRRFAAWPPSSGPAPHPALPP